MPCSKIHHLVSPPFSPLDLVEYIANEQFASFPNFSDERYPTVPIEQVSVCIASQIYQYCSYMACQLTQAFSNSGRGPWLATQLTLSLSIGLASFLFFCFARRVEKWKVLYSPRTLLKGRSLLAAGCLIRMQVVLSWEGLADVLGRWGISLGPAGMLACWIGPVVQSSITRERTRVCSVPESCASVCGKMRTAALLTI